MKPQIGKLYKVRHYLRREGSSHTWPAMPLWIPEEFGGPEVYHDDELYHKPLLLWGFHEHSFDPEHLVEFLYIDQTYWTDWFKLDDFFDYFEPCSQK